VDNKYKPLVAQLLAPVYLQVSEDGHALSTKLPSDGRIILQSEGRFSMDRLSISGGSVGLFEGKRIGRAKNIEQLALEIKAQTQQNQQLQSQLTEQLQALEALHAQSQQTLIDETRFEINRIGNEVAGIR